MNLLDIHTHSQGIENSIFSLGPDLKILNSGYFSAGLHPWFLDENWKIRYGKIKELAENPNLVAIGEAGLDRLRGPDLHIQKAAFSAQSELAFDLNIPLILHCVKAHDLLLEFLKKAEETPSIIWHGFNLKPHLAEQLLEFPLYFSFGKAVLQPDSNASKWLKICPLDRIFLETDDSELEISSIYQAASVILQLPVNTLGVQAVENWNSISKRKIHE